LEKAVANLPTEVLNFFCIRKSACCRDNSQSRKKVAERRKMNLHRIRLFSLLLLVACAGTKTACAQETPKQEAPKVSERASATREGQTEDGLREHHFWDRGNSWLFAGVGAARTLDYFSTLNMRRRGRQEIFLTNDVVDNHPAFATIEAAGTGTSIGASYLFHHYGHHKLERWTSFVHISLATTGVVRNYCLKTAHSKTTP
jgi:hypothetical protein